MLIERPRISGSPFIVSSARLEKQRHELADHRPVCKLLRHGPLLKYIEDAHKNQESIWSTQGKVQ